MSFATERELSIQLSLSRRPLEPLDPRDVDFLRYFGLLYLLGRCYSFAGSS